MKNIITILLIISTLGLFSCSKDYLNTSPSDEASPTTVFKTVANAQYAINGLNLLMSTQKLGSQGFSGEGVIKIRWGNWTGNNTPFPHTGFSSVTNMDYLVSNTSTYSVYPWFYYYHIISNANLIIKNIDQIEGLKEEIDFIQAQALTFRAYCYMQLIQIYSPRWMDSNNGSADGVVLRLEPTTDDMPLSTMAEVYAQIYADLDAAIAMYTSSGISKQNDFDPDLNVAYAIYARTAINKSDYEVAKKYAPMARDGYPLMSNKEAEGGFHTPNKEWIWYNYGGEDEQLYYYSYHCYVGMNSNTSWTRSYAPSVSKELWEKIPDTDVRKDMWWINPGTESYNKSTGQMNSTFSKAFIKEAQSYPEVNKITSKHKIFAWANKKIRSFANPGVGNVNHFRSAEMYLIEAEARYNTGDAAGACALLEELNAERNPSYSCDLSGAALLEEIKFYYQVELWGEGFDWFLLKRWGDSINRKSFEEGGNFVSNQAVEISPNEKNDWIYVIPRKETDYNELI